MIDKTEPAELTDDDLDVAEGGLASTNGGHPVADKKSKILSSGDSGIGDRSLSSPA